MPTPARRPGQPLVIRYQTDGPMAHTILAHPELAGIYTDFEIATPDGWRENAPGTSLDDVAEWAARNGYEVVKQTHDVTKPARGGRFWCVAELRKVQVH